MLEALDLSGENWLVKEKKKIKKILCSCGTGVATCSFISSEIVQFLKDNDIEAEVLNCKASDIEDRYDEADLIVSTCQLPPKINRPKVSGVPFITGNDLEDTKLKILELLK
jgi:PTS system galactitol-specific IIB component